MRILVAGAGYVGSALASQLASAGHDVLALRRSPSPAQSATRGGARWLGCDLSDARAVSELPLEGVDALAYLVAADARDDEAYRRAYVGGLAALLQRLAGAQGLIRINRL